MKLNMKNVKLIEMVWSWIWRVPNFLSYMRLYRLDKKLREKHEMYEIVWGWIWNEECRIFRGGMGKMWGGMNVVRLPMSECESAQRELDMRCEIIWWHTIPRYHLWQRIKRCILVISDISLFYSPIGDWI